MIFQTKKVQIGEDPQNDTDLINKDSFLHLSSVLDTLLDHIACKLVLGQMENFATHAVH